MTMKRIFLFLACCLAATLLGACDPKEISVSAISLKPYSVVLTEGETTTLVASVYPEDATDPTITWSSSNKAVATVDPDGVVTAVQEGTSYVSAKANNGVMTNCAVVVESVVKAVDMGLSVKWCSCNVGAERPEEYGNYYAWGETSTKEIYDWSTYTLCNGAESTLTKYCLEYYNGTVDNKTVLEKVDDVAAQELGGKWRMPTREEVAELTDTKNCTWIWCTENGVNGYKVTSKKTGNSIFLPAGGGNGGIVGDGLVYVGTRGFYWASSLYTDNHDSNEASTFAFGSSWIENGGCGRCVGQSVRPVRP